MLSSRLNLMDHLLKYIHYILWISNDFDIYFSFDVSACYHHHLVVGRTKFSLWSCIISIPSTLPRIYSFFFVVFCFPNLRLLRGYSQLPSHDFRECRICHLKKCLIFWFDLIRPRALYNTKFYDFEKNLPPDEQRLVRTSVNKENVFVTWLCIITFIFTIEIINFSCWN